MCYELLGLFSSSAVLGRTYIDQAEVSGRNLLRSTEFADVSKCWRDHHLLTSQDPFNVAWNRDRAYNARLVSDAEPRRRSSRSRAKEQSPRKQSQEAEPQGAEPWG